jgi:FtsP/CotA-like multicopper oxidase with cupredoxin domain
LFADPFGVHEDDLYGDINMVSGIPFPVMNIEPKWNRFRILNAAVARPWLIKIKDSNLKDISQHICKIIATDGGYRNDPVDYPVEGLLIGVAERYEIVCDFTKLNSRTLYFWNDQDTRVMKDVPYFCNSHLISKVVISATTSGLVPVFNPAQNDPIIMLDKVLSASSIQTAIAMANNGRAHREFVFGRSNGHWVINGETWTSNKIAASNVGQNTWELWKMKTGGGWFHPIHIHLVDFLLIKRENPDSPLAISSNGLRTNEFLSPKDVFYLGPGDTVYVIARFGAHKGDYMFHCHNLIHEDNDMMRAFRVTDSNNGLNAQNSEIKKVKVIKIKGIKMKDGVKQKSETYWYNPDTGVVYDFDLDYQIGRVKMEKDEKGMNTKIATKIEENNEVYYVIEEIVNIPSVRII